MKSNKVAECHHNNANQVNPATVSEELDGVTHFVTKRTASIARPFCAGVLSGFMKCACMHLVALLLLCIFL